MNSKRVILALSGGVGGAKLAAGLAACLPPGELDIVANTGDDFEHLGLHIAPDLDSVMYALASLNDRQRGWGLANESWNCMQAMEKLNGPTWFSLGDQDLATHLQRSQLLREGQSLTEATAALCQALGIGHRLLPMTDSPVRTMVQTSQGDLEFQNYFVEQQCEPEVSGFYFRNIESAAPQADFISTLKAGSYSAVVICPSNPFVSVDPILTLPGVRDALLAFSGPVVAVSPIVGGQALKGPAAKMMKELGMPSEATAVARYYRELLSDFVLDQADAGCMDGVQALGMRAHCTATVMKSAADQRQLAADILSVIGDEG